MLETLQNTILRWRQRRGASKTEWKTTSPDFHDIVFDPLPPGEVVCVCPVTRQSLASMDAIYQCRRCRMSYSPEGWRFLRQNAHGQCCGCHAKKTITLLSKDNSPL